MNDEQTMTAPPPPTAASQGGSLTKKPWTVEVDIHLEKGGSNPKFSLYTTLPVVNGQIQFQNNHRPGFNVNFNLIDETGEGYTFPPQSKVDDACWSQLGTTCPTASCKAVFDPRRVSNGGMTLEVYNDNPSPPIGAFSFTLRVTKDGGTTYSELDPGGNDGNGPRS